MKAGFCLLIQLFVQNAQSEPDTNVHVYIPQEQRPEQQPEQQEQQPDTHHHVFVPPEQHGGEFCLVIGAQLYVPIYQLYILWSSMDNRKLPFVNSVMFVSNICSCALRHQPPWCPPITTSTMVTVSTLFVHHCNQWPKPLYAIFQHPGKREM